MKKLFAIALLASFTTLAAPLQWTCDWPEAKSQTFSLYQGETATFEPTFRVNGRTVTNATIEAVWYQTNGMGNAWWKLDGATFAPSNDVGAAAYRFFVEARVQESGVSSQESALPPDPSALTLILYRANGALRMLPSPGFTPNAIEPPIVSLDFSTIEVANAPYYDKAETEAKIVELAPAPGDYANVSNKAMTALQSYTESDPSVHTWAKAATKPSYTASEVGATTAADVYRLVAGTNVVLVVTNYNSATHAAAMKLQHLDPESGQYVTYWDELRQHGITYTNGMNYTDAAIAERAAPRAWSGTTSGLGSEAPAGVTWISTPETVIAGGFEYEKVVTSAGAVWVLTSNGMSTGATSNSFFRVAASDGTELFSIEKTDSYLIGVNADGITRSGNTVTIPINVVAAEHPYIRCTKNLVNPTWEKEDEGGLDCAWATVSWSGTTGAYVATVTTAEPQAFFYFEYMVGGQVKIKNSAKTEMSGGILFNGTTYLPTVNGNKLEFVAQ